MTKPALNAVNRYFQLKKKHRDRVVIVRTGDFYETFDEDARTLAATCELVVTSQTSESGSIPMSGFPFYVLDARIESLLAAGHKVAVAETDKDVRLFD